MKHWSTETNYTLNGNAKVNLNRQIYTSYKRMANSCRWNIHNLANQWRDYCTGYPPYLHETDIKMYMHTCMCLCKCAFILNKNQIWISVTFLLICTYNALQPICLHIIVLLTLMSYLCIIWLLSYSNMSVLLVVFSGSDSVFICRVWAVMVFMSVIMTIILVC